MGEQSTAVIEMTKSWNGQDNKAHCKYEQKENENENTGDDVDGCSQAAAAAAVTTIKKRSDANEKKLDEMKSKIYKWSTNEIRLFNV